MLLRRVARNPKPDRARRAANDRTKPERRSPAMMHHHVGDQRRSKSCTGSDASKDPTVGNTALADRYPACDELVGRRIDHCLASAEQEAHGHQRPKRTSDVSWYEGCKCGEDSPPQHPCGQYAPWTKAICEATADCLKSRVSDQKRAEDSAELHVGEPEIVGNGPCSHGSVDPVQIRDCTENEEPEHQGPADVRGVRNHL